MDPDPGCPETRGSGFGSGSATLVRGTDPENRIRIPSKMVSNPFWKELIR